MKIGIYSPYLSTFGGGERYVLTLAEHLSFKNDVSIFWDKDITDQALERLAINIKNVAFVNNIFSKKIFNVKVKLAEIYRFSKKNYLSFHASIPTNTKLTTGTKPINNPHQPGLPRASAIFHQRKQARAVITRPPR